MEVKYYVCNHCGNIIEMVKDKGVPVADCNMHILLLPAHHRKDRNLHGLWKC